MTTFSDKVGVAQVAGALTLGAALLLAACGTTSTPTPYQPVDPLHQSRGGYSDVRIDANRYRVSFSGNRLTSRATVETYLLYRAAQLTLENGWDWFVMDQRATDKQTTISTSSSGFVGPGFGAWGPSWRYFDAGVGWNAWSPRFTGPFGAPNFDMTTIDRFETSAEIVMFKGAKPAPDALEARQVVANLAASIARPS